MPRPSKEFVSPKRYRQTTIGDFASSSPASNNDRRALQPSTRLTRRSQKRVSSSSESKQDGETSDVGAIRFEPEVLVISDDDDEEPQPPRVPRTKRSTRPTRAISDEERNARSDNEIDSEADVGVPVRWGSKGRGQRKRARIADTDSEDESRRHLIKGARPSSPEDLSDEIDAEKIIEPRLRARGKLTMFQKNLEKLKRRQKRKQRMSYSQSSHSDGDSNEDGYSPIPGARPTLDSDASSTEEEVGQEAEDAFIVEDDVKDVAPELPVQFRNQQDLTYQFKIICQLFVHLATRSPKERLKFMKNALKDDYFGACLSLTRRKMDGLRDSLVVSSIWRPDFKGRLEKYPEFNITSLKFTIPGCDACHLGGRKSTRRGVVSGEPYDRTTFETVTDSEDDADHDKRSKVKRRARRTRREPSLSTSNNDSSENENAEHTDMSNFEFHLGRFCAARSETYHRFMHWEYSLYQALTREIEALKAADGTGRSFVCVAFAAGQRPPEDMDDADGLMDWLDRRGVIDFEWQKMKELMDAARNLEIRAKRGEDADL